MSAGEVSTAAGARRALRKGCDNVRPSGNKPFATRVSSYQAATMRAINQTMRPRMERATPRRRKEQAMNAALLVHSLVAVSLPLSGASAARYAVHVRPEDRALTANPQMTPQAEGCSAAPANPASIAPFRSGAANGQALGYDCLNNANGS